MHPLHDIQVPEDFAAFFPVVIEIPRGSKLKYEIDGAPEVGTNCTPGLASIGLKHGGKGVES